MPDRAVVSDPAPQSPDRTSAPPPVGRREKRRRLKRAARDDFANHVIALSSTALLDLADGLWWTLDDPDWTDEDRALFRLRRSERMVIVQAELERRRRLQASGHLPPPAVRAHSAQLERLCRAIREQVHLGHVIEDLGMELTRRGREFHSACPQCGGEDRFVIWPPPRSRGWCRQCAWGPDAIEFWRWFDGSSFADAVVAIAERYLGMEVGR